jgi:hypothetical protein
MKKLVVILFTMLVLAITGCSDNETTNIPVSKEKEKDVFFGIYSFQLPTVLVGPRDYGSDASWTIVAVDTDFDNIPDRSFYIKVSTCQELNKHCGKDSVSFVCGAKQAVDILDETGKVVSWFNEPNDPHQKPVIFSILGYKKK